MIVRQFQISTDYTEPRRWFWVRVYDSPESLRKVAGRVRPKDDFATALGTVQEVTPWVPEGVGPKYQDFLSVDDLGFPDNGFAGVIRLCVDWLTPEILVHETLHAALVVYRMNISQRPQLEGRLDVERNNEEALAYAGGQLYGELVTGMLKAGFEL